MKKWSAPAPAEVVYVVGDIHGCVGKLESLLARIDDDIATSAGGKGAVVFVGDYIDRGEQSAEVLRFVAEVTKSYPGALIGLMGNHERMLLDFLADPTGRAKRWLRHGGLQTLASFGVGGALTTDSSGAGDLMDAAGDLTEAMGPALIDWVTDLPLSWSSGTLWVTHAGAHPKTAMDAQDPKILLWGTDAFMKKDRKDGKWIAFGHIPIDPPVANEGRISVDTGAVYGGPLTAARVDPDGTISFLKG